jgi:copper chaperone
MFEQRAEHRSSMLTLQAGEGLASDGSSIQIHGRSPVAISLEVDGIHCGSCAKRITAAIHKIAPGTRVEIDIPKGKVAVDGRAEQEAIVRAIQDAGYALRNAA